MHIYEANENVMKKNKARQSEKIQKQKINEKKLSKAYKKQTKVT